MVKIKVLVADDHPTFCEGLCRFLNEQPDIEVVARAGNGEEAIRLAQEMVPDVAIIDIAMPGTDGIGAARQIRATCPTTAVLMVSAFDYESYVLASLRAGAAGYMIKNAPVSELISAIRLLRSGESVFDREAIGKVLRRLGSTATGENVAAGLHQGELEVLRRAAKGASNREIAQELGLSERTVQSHMLNIFRKLGVGSRTAAVLHALREGWLTPNDLP